MSIPQAVKAIISPSTSILILDLAHLVTSSSLFRKWNKQAQLLQVNVFSTKCIISCADITYLKFLSIDAWKTCNSV